MQLYAIHFIAKEDNRVVGIITGHSYYKGVYIGGIIIFEKYRNKHIGSKLIKTVEDYYKNEWYENINLTNYKFQAPKFYKKCGFEVEFIRESKENS